MAFLLPMHIGILGSGNVGGTLGKRWAEIGHNVTFATRDAASIQAAAEAEVVVVALPWDAAQKVLESVDLKGKIVLDVMNPILPDLAGIAIGTTTSGGEQVAKWAPGASVVKIFNTTGYRNMADPIYDNEPAVMFYCGGTLRRKQSPNVLRANWGSTPSTPAHSKTRGFWNRWPCCGSGWR